MVVRAMCGRTCAMCGRTCAMCGRTCAMCGRMCAMCGRSALCVVVRALCGRTCAMHQSNYLLLQHNSSLHFPITRKDRWDTIDDFLTSSLHVSLFTTALWESVNSIPVHSLMLSSHLFFCLPLCLPPPLTVPCNIVFARPDDLVL